MNSRKFVVLFMMMALVLSAVLPASAVLIQSFAGIGQRAEEATTTVTVNLAILDKDGKLVTGLTKSNFRLYSKVGLGLVDAGGFAFTIAEVASYPGTYVMRITPSGENTWQALGYKFGFVVKKDASTGLGEVLVINMVSATASVTGSSLTPDQKAQVLQLLSPPK